MRDILTIAVHEIFRLARRWRWVNGGAGLSFKLRRLAPWFFILGVLLASGYLLAGRMPSLRDIPRLRFSVLGFGLYRVGVSGDLPRYLTPEGVLDGRFQVQRVTEEEGAERLRNEMIDVWIDGRQVYHRQDQRSLVCMGALRRYMQEQEILRIGNEHPPEIAFPLRVGVTYLAPGQPLPSGEGAMVDEIVIPSLMSPPTPFVEVIISLLFILPVTFISIFFTSSFMEEKLNRRLSILLSAPITPLQIILGKMIPYAIFALIAVAVIAVLTGGNVFEALLIFTPTTLFIFAIYLMVPLFYRTFKDTTFISMLVTTLTTAFMVAPAMFADAALPGGMSDLAYLSPLTLAVKMLRGESYTWRQYLFPALPMAAIFGFSMYAGTRLINEEFLMGYRPMTRKIKDAVYLMMEREHPYRSVALLSLLIIPMVYLLQLIILAFSTNLPPSLMLASLLLAAAFIEEVAKSIGIVVWIERGLATTARQVFGLAFLSGLGFLIGEKGLLLLSISQVSQTALGEAILSGGFLLIPLAVHTLFTALAGLLRLKTRLPYMVILILVTVLHSMYNFLLLRGAL